MQNNKKLFFIGILLMLLSWSRFYPWYKHINSNVFFALSRFINLLIEYPIISLIALLIVAYNLIKRNYC